MGLAFFHNPDWLATDDLALVFDTVDNAEVTAAGYDGTAGLTAPASSPAVAGSVRKALPLIEPTRFRIGCRFKVTSAPPDSQLVLGICDPALEIHVAVVLEPDLSLAVYRGALDVGPLGGVSSTPIALDTWMRLGFRGVLAAVGGEVELFSDATALLQVTGVNTVDTTVQRQGGILIGLSADMISGHYYVIDVGTPGYKTLLPDLLVTPQWPTSAGTYSDFTANTGTVPAAVDDVTQDADTTYAGAPVTAVQRLSLAMQALDAAIYRIYGTQVNAVMRTVDVSEVADLTATPILVTEGHLSAGPFHALTTSYALLRALWERNPATAVPWRVAEVNAAEAGVRVGT